MASTLPADSTPSFWKAWPWWSTPALAALLLVLWFVDPFVGDWDGMDYTMLSLAGHPSSMALGRNLFIFGNHALYQLAHSLFNVQPENAYLIFKYAVVAQAPLAVIACWVLARDFSRSIPAATLAAIFLVFSPVFVLYGGQVMTDVPSVLVLAVALAIHYRGLRKNSIWLILFGAGLLGLGVNLRETVGFYAPWLVLAPFVCGWKPGRRRNLVIGASCLVFLLFAFGWFGFWFITDAHYRMLWFGWRESMRQETGRHPVRLQNLLPYLAYFLISAPLIFLSLPFAIRNEWRQRKISPILLLGAMGLVADVLLIFNYSTAVNWRYFLTGLPALAPLAAKYLLDALGGRLKNTLLAFAICVTSLMIFAGVFGLWLRPVSRQFIERRTMSRDYRKKLAGVPRDAVMISGAQTIAVNYWHAIGAGNWETIGTGGGWPGDKFVPLIEDHLRNGRRVFLDSDPRSWLPCGWQRDEIPAIVSLERQFSFRRVMGTIYEIRPRGEQGALDSPNLERLLPEHRPEDVKRCPPGGY